MKPIQISTEKYLPPDNDLDLSTDSMPSVISERPYQAFSNPLPYQSDPKVFQKWRAFDNAANFKESREVVKKQANQHFKQAHIGGGGHHQNPKMEYVVEINDQNNSSSRNKGAPYNSLSKKVVKGIKSSGKTNDENQPAMMSYGIVGAERPAVSQEYESLMKGNLNKTNLKPPQQSLPKIKTSSHHENQYIIPQYQQNKEVSEAGRLNMGEREGVLQEKNFNAPMREMQQVYENMYARQMDERKGSSFDQTGEYQSFSQSLMSEHQEYQPVVFNEQQSHPSMLSKVIPRGSAATSFQKKEKDEGMLSYSSIPQNTQSVANTSIVEFIPTEITEDYRLTSNLTDRTQTGKGNQRRRYIDLENVPEQERSLMDIVNNNQYQNSGKKVKDTESSFSTNNLPLKEYALNYYKSAKDLNITDNSNMTRYYSPESKRYDTEEDFQDVEQPASQRNTYIPPQSSNASFVSCISEAEPENNAAEEPEGRGSTGIQEQEVYYDTFRSQYEQQQQYGLSRITEEDESLTRDNISKREISPKKTESSVEINPLLTTTVESVNIQQPYLMNILMTDPHSQAATELKNTIESQKMFDSHSNIELESQRLTTKSTQMDKENTFEIISRPSESKATVMEKDISDATPVNRQSLGDRSFKSPSKQEKSYVKENSPSSMYYLDTSVATRNFEPALSNKNDNIVPSSSNPASQAGVSEVPSLRNTENQLQSVKSEDTRRSLINQEINAYSIENLESIDMTATLEIADTILKHSKKPETETVVVSTAIEKPPVKLLHSIPSKLMPDPWPGYPEENYLTIRLINAPPAPSEMYSAREEREKQVFESNKKEKVDSGESVIQFHWNEARKSLETLEREVNNISTSANIEAVPHPNLQELVLNAEIYTPAFAETCQAESWVPEKVQNEVQIKEVLSQMTEGTEEGEEKYNVSETEKQGETEMKTEEDQEQEFISQNKVELLEKLEKLEDSSEQKSTSQMIFETRHSTSPLNTEPAVQRMSNDINLQAFSDISNVENRSSIKTESVPSGPVQVHLSIDELERQVNTEKRVEGQQQNIENYYWAERHNSLSKQLAQNCPQVLKDQKHLNSLLEAGVLTQSIEISPNQQVDSNLFLNSDTEAYLMNKINSFSSTPFQVTATEDIDKRHSLSDEKEEQLESQRSGERPSHSELDADKLMNSANYQDFSHEIHESPSKGNQNIQAQIDNMFSYDAEMDMIDSNQIPLDIESIPAIPVDHRSSSLRSSHVLLGRGPLPVIEEINSTHIQETSANDVENSLEFKRHFSNVSIDKDYCMTEPEPVLSRVLTDSPNPLSNRSLNTLELGPSPGFEIVHVSSSDQKVFSGIDAVSYSNQISDDNIEEEIQKLQAELMLLSSKHMKKAVALNIP